MTEKRRMYIGKRLTNKSTEKKKNQPAKTKTTSKMSITMRMPNQRGMRAFSILLSNGLNKRKQNNATVNGRVTDAAIFRAAAVRMTAMTNNAVLPASRGA